MISLDYYLFVLLFGVLLANSILLVYIIVNRKRSVNIKIELTNFGSITSDTFRDYLDMGVIEHE